MSDQAWQRRQAVQIVSMLPEDLDDATRVLELAKELLDGFLRPAQPAREVSATVLPFSDPASAKR